METNAMEIGYAFYVFIYFFVFALNPTRIAILNFIKSVTHWQRYIQTKQTDKTYLSGGASEK